MLLFRMSLIFCEKKVLKKLLLHSLFQQKTCRQWSFTKFLVLGLNLNLIMKISIA